MDECIKIFRERNAPSIAAQPGFHHGHWWVDRPKGLATSVTFWEDVAGERASWTNIPGLVERMADVLASDEVHQETLEGVHHQYLPGRRDYYRSRRPLGFAQRMLYEMLSGFKRPNIAIVSADTVIVKDPLGWQLTSTCLRGGAHPR
jgi:hypothetical protein